MINLRAILLTLIACAGLQAQCLPGGLAVIVNKANATESLSMAQLRKLILGDVRTWPDKRPVTLVSRELSSDVFKCVLSSIIRMNDAEYHRYILSTEFRGAIRWL
jgi:ABC-type phosphate transport system substrate-binding protein